MLRRHGIAVRRYDGELGRGLFLPDDAAMNPARRALGLATPVLRLRPGCSRTARSPRSAPAGSQTAGGTVSAGLVVVAVDGRLELLLPELAGRVRTARLQMLATEPVAAGPAALPGVRPVGL